jgi:hypothetical protein
MLCKTHVNFYTLRSLLFLRMNLMLRGRACGELETCKCYLARKCTKREGTMRHTVFFSLKNQDILELPYGSNEEYF